MRKPPTRENIVTLELLNDRIKEFKTPAEILSLVRPLLDQTLRSYDELQEPHRLAIKAQLDRQEQHMTEIYGNGSGKPGFLERARKEDKEVQRKLEGKIDSMQDTWRDQTQTFENTLHIVMEESKKAAEERCKAEEERKVNAMRAAIVSELAQKSAAKWDKYKGWIVLGASSGAFTAIYEISTRMYRHFVLHLPYLNHTR